MSAGRRVRGVVATSVVWALAWTLAGVPLGLISWYEINAAWPPLRFLVPSVAAWGVWGAISGALFATMVTTCARSRALADLSRWRAAVWGALAVLALPGVVLASLVVEDGVAGLEIAVVTLGVAVAVGAGLASGTLALAQRGTGEMRNEERASVIREAAT